MKRLTESKLGLILGIVLAMVWIASMSVADSNVCTAAPLLWDCATCGKHFHPPTGLRKRKDTSFF